MPSPPSTPADMTPDALARKGWNPEQIAAFLAAQHEAADEEAALLAQEQEREAAAAAPEAVIAALRAEAAVKRAARELAERERKADRVYAEACVTYGEERTARVRTIRGSIILRPMTMDEVDAATLRADSLKKMDLVKLGRSQIRALTLYPPADVLKEWTDAFPGLWNDLYQARDAIAAGVREDAEKKE